MMTLLFLNVRSSTNLTLLKVGKLSHNIYPRIDIGFKLDFINV